MVPGTGIQLNNMLGEADLNPDGFHATPPGQRMGSMMSPSILVAPDGGVLALGTGGSERIRSSMVEVLMRIVDGGQSLAQAVSAARVHPDDRGLQVEPMLPADLVEGLRAGSISPVNVWPAHNLFFGGVNAVQRMPDGSVRAVADGRRGGGALVVAGVSGARPSRPVRGAVRQDPPGVPGYDQEVGLVGGPLGLHLDRRVRQLDREDLRAVGDVEQRRDASTVTDRGRDLKRQRGVGDVCRRSPAHGSSRGTCERISMSCRCRWWIGQPHGASPSGRSGNIGRTASSPPNLSSLIPRNACSSP